MGEQHGEGRTSTAEPLLSALFGGRRVVTTPKRFHVPSVGVCRTKYKIQGLQRSQRLRALGAPQAPGAASCLPGVLTASFQPQPCPTGTSLKLCPRKGHVPARVPTAVTLAALTSQPQQPYDPWCNRQERAGAGSSCRPDVNHQNKKRSTPCPPPRLGTAAPGPLSDGLGYPAPVTWLQHRAACQPEKDGAANGAQQALSTSPSPLRAQAAFWGPSPAPVPVPVPPDPCCCSGGGCSAQRKPPCPSAVCPTSARSGQVGCFPLCCKSSRHLRHLKVLGSFSSP